MSPFDTAAVRPLHWKRASTSTGASARTALGLARGAVKFSGLRASGAGPTRQRVSSASPVALSVRLPSGQPGSADGAWRDCRPRRRSIERRFPRGSPPGALSVHGRLAPRVSAGAPCDSPRRMRHDGLKFARVASQVPRRGMPVRHCSGQRQACRFTCSSPAGAGRREGRFRNGRPKTHE